MVTLFLVLGICFFIKALGIGEGLAPFMESLGKEVAKSIDEKNAKKRSMWEKHHGEEIKANWEKNSKESPISVKPIVDRLTNEQDKLVNEEIRKNTADYDIKLANWEKYKASLK
jgi:hypothetical protein